MPLSLQRRRVGDVIIVKCAGQIIMGPASEALKAQFDELLPHDPHIVLDVGGVDFVDSSGLGIMVRLRNRAQFAHGDLKFCSVPARFEEVLKITRLATIFERHPSEEAAIAAFYDRPRAAGEPTRFRTDVLCVESSADVLAYVCEVLKQAGLGVLTSTNLPDALMLLKATPPKAIVIGATLRAMRGTWTADSFHTLAAAIPIVELPADFSAHDAGQAAAGLMETVQTALGRGIGQA